MALEGTFHDTALVDLFEIFRMGNKTGVLRLLGPSQHGTIHVTMGRLIDASVYDAITQRLVAAGDDAVLHLLKWTTAEFAFIHDPSTVRHPVTIFLTTEQLLRLGAEVSPPTPHTAPAPHMAMSIVANLAFMRDLEPSVNTADRQISRNYRRLSSFSTAYASSAPTQPIATEQVQPVQSPRAVASSAGRKLLAAVLRRVREI